MGEKLFGNRDSNPLPSKLVILHQSRAIFASLGPFWLCFLFINQRSSLVPIVKEPLL